MKSPLDARAEDMPTPVTRTVDRDALAAVTGGLATPEGMAPPKYSAGWWDHVRNGGVKPLK